MGTNYIWNTLSNGLTQTQGNCNLGSAQATTLSSKVSPLPPQTWTLSLTWQVYTTLFFRIIFQKREWQGVRVCAWRVSVHTCTHRMRRWAVSSKLEGKGLPSGMASASSRATLPSSLPRDNATQPCHSATLLRGGIGGRGITIPARKGRRIEVHLGPQGPHLSDKETRIQVDSRGKGQGGRVGREAFQATHSLKANASAPRRSEQPKGPSGCVWGWRYPQEMRSFAQKKKGVLINSTLLPKDGDQMFQNANNSFWNNPGISPGNVFIIHILLATGAPITRLLLSMLLTNY